jgi:hypothetical protein
MFVRGFYTSGQGILEHEDVDPQSPFMSFMFLLSNFGFPFILILFKSAMAFPMKAFRIIGPASLK